MYDIYLAAAIAGGTVTNGYGIYQANSKLNHFAGRVNFAGGTSVGGVNGHTGWIDDGVNFRATFTDGILTGVANSTAGGWA
jgi:hypothetical protein